MFDEKMTAKEVWYRLAMNIFYARSDEKVTNLFRAYCKQQADAEMQKQILSIKRKQSTTHAPLMRKVSKLSAPSK